MHILLDECVHAGVRAAFPGHVVSTVSEIGSHGTKDGPLLALAQERFDVFVTVDRNLQHQHSLTKYQLGFIVARVPSNEIRSYRPIFEALLDAAERVKPGEIKHVGHPLMRS